jgi:hypothetical protein
MSIVHNVNANKIKNKIEVEKKKLTVQLQNRNGRSKNNAPVILDDFGINKSSCTLGWFILKFLSIFKGA